MHAATTTKELRLSWACDVATRSKLNDLAKKLGTDASSVTRAAVELYIAIAEQLPAMTRAASALDVEPGKYVSMVLEKANVSVSDSIKSLVSSLNLDLTNEARTSQKQAFEAAKKR